MAIQIRLTLSRRIDLRKRFWLRVIVFPALFAVINALFIGCVYVLNALNWLDFQLEEFAWFAWAYPISIFFILSLSSVLKLRAEDRASKQETEPHEKSEADSAR